MDFDPTAAVIGIVIEAESDTAALRPLLANSPDELVRLIGGNVEAIEVDGGSVLWMDEGGKNQGLATNLLATKIAHRLNAGLYPDDTINGRADRTAVRGRTERFNSTSSACCGERTGRCPILLVSGRFNCLRAMQGFT